MQAPSSVARRDDHYDVIIVGSGIASTFFLHRLRERQPRARVLVLEAGARYEHASLVRDRTQLVRYSSEHYINRTPHKIWHFSRAFGGGTNCWFGSTPRMLPEDFQLRRHFGVGSDWPIGYDELEPHYTRAEQLMRVAGASPMPYPMSAPYPLPPHRFSEPDRLLHAADPVRFVHLPTARASQADERARCCNNGVCSLCPVDAKFTIANALSHAYAGDATTLVTGAPVVELWHSRRVVDGVKYRQEGRERRATADLVVLGANALFNPFLLLRSGLDHPQTGRGLCEQVGATAMVTLRGLRNFHGSTITTGLGFADLYGEHRRERGGFLYHTVNRAMNLSPDRGREFSQLEVIVAIEDLRQDDNRVEAGDDPLRPVVRHRTHSAYAQRTLDRLPELLANHLAPLPMEKLEIVGMRPTESHIQGTTVMGDDPSTSVVDAHCRHHAYRNVVVLGSGNFPTASPANPSLTIAALALHAADHV
jgi:choline dehydrogenase-like flavoprotein